MYNYEKFGRGIVVFWNVFDLGLVRGCLLVGLLRDYNIYDFGRRVEFGRYFLLFHFLSFRFLIIL